MFVEYCCEKEQESYLVDRIQSLRISERRRYEALKWQQECQGVGGRYKMRLNPFHMYMYRNSKELNTIKYRVKTSRNITLNS